MKLQHFVAGIMAVCALCSMASAASVSKGVHVTNLYINTADSMVFVTIDTTITGGPACATTTTQYVMPLTTALGNQAYALLVAARGSATAITLGGTGTCSTYNGVETLQQIVW